MAAQLDNGEEFNPLDDPEEKRVLWSALDSFRQYRQAAHYNVTHLRRQSFYSLSIGHTEILSKDPISLQRSFAQVDDAIDCNAAIAESVLDLGLDTYGVDLEADDWRGKATPNDMDKARSTIRQLYREWSPEGAEERERCFKPLIAALNEHYSSTDPEQRGKIQVLVPGAGLGRLVLEVCLAGYSSEGNEISYHQLLMSNWILNQQPQPKAHAMYPWALSFSNHISRANQLAKVMIPDIAPGTALYAAIESSKTGSSTPPEMSMSSGDFCVLYKQAQYQNAFGAVLTCFFIDTAPNLISYIETIQACLQNGGAWINLGPLLWHFDGDSKPRSSGKTPTEPEMNLGIGESGSFELTDEEVIALLRGYGFRIVHHDNTTHMTGYIQDPNSMLQNTYRPSFWIAIKDEAI